MKDFFTVALVGNVSLLLWVFQTTPRSRSKQTENDTAAILTSLSNIGIFPIVYGSPRSSSEISLLVLT